MVLLTAEEFGYGPAVTLNCIVKNLKELYRDKYVFMGAGVAIEQAKNSNLYDEYVVCNTYDTSSLEQYENWFKQADFVISVENPNGAIFSLKCNKKVFYIDNLFWMWDKLPEELKHVTRYFVTDIFEIKQQIDRLRFYTNNLVRVGPLREFAFKENNSIVPDTLLVNLGGGDSFLNDKDLVNRYYAVLCNTIINAVEKTTIRSITICGGNTLINYLKHECNAPNVHFVSLDHKQYLQLLHTSQHIILSPGLGNYFEILNIEPEIMMIPSINYSQFLQLENFRGLAQGIRILNWSDFNWYKEVKPFQEESMGVNAVLSNIKYFVEHTDSQQLLGEHIDNYLSRDQSSWLPRRSQILMEFGNNGINTVMAEIMKEISADVSF